MALPVFLFPGLGSYSEGMLRQARRTHPEVDEVFAEIDAAAAPLGVAPVAKTLFDGPPARVEELLDGPQEVYQLAIFGACMSVHRILTAAGLRPALLVGHSFGETVALIAAGAFSVADGTRLVCARVRALAAWEGWGGMAAVGVDGETAAHLIGVANEPDLVVACHNAARQSVLAGPLPAIDGVARVAQALGLPFTRLRVPYAFHHPGMRPAMAGFLAATSGIRQQPPRVPVYSPMHRRRHTGAEDLRQAIAEAMVRPVAFADTIRELHAKGFTHFVEVGPGRALTRCVDQTVPQVRTFAPLYDVDAEVEGLRAAAQLRPPEKPDVPRKPADTGRAAPAPAAAAPSGLDRARVLAELRELYAQELEYPPEFITDETILDAELGVNSLKQASLLTKVVNRFGLDDSSGPPDPRHLPTVSDIADYVTGQRR